MIDGLDEADQAFIASMVPKDGIATAFLAVVSFIDSEGINRWKGYYQTSDYPVSMTVGLLEMAKLDILKRCEDDQLGDD